jgi:hypothetical protein
MIALFCRFNCASEVPDRQGARKECNSEQDAAPCIFLDLFVSAFMLLACLARCIVRISEQWYD